MEIKKEKAAVGSLFTVAEYHRFMLRLRREIKTVKKHLLTPAEIGEMAARIEKEMMEKKEGKK